MNVTAFKEAQEAYARGDYERALEGFGVCAHELGELAPADLSKFYHLIGNCYIKVGQPAQAAEYYQKALGTSPRSRKPSLLVNLGTAQLGARRYEDALISFTSALDYRDYATPYRAHSGIGAAQLKLGNTAQAGAAYRAAALDQANPMPAKALVNLGVCFMELGRPADAIVSYETALEFELDPIAQAKALSNLGQAYMAEGRAQKAIEAFEEALESGVYELTPMAKHDYAIACKLRDRLDSKVPGILNTGFIPPMPFAQIDEDREPERDPFAPRDMGDEAPYEEPEPEPEPRQRVPVIGKAARKKPGTAAAAGAAAAGVAAGATVSAEAAEAAQAAEKEAAEAAARKAAEEEAARKAAEEEAARKAAEEEAARKAAEEEAARKAAEEEVARKAAEEAAAEEAARKAAEEEAARKAAEEEAARKATEEEAARQAEQERAAAEAARAAAEEEARLAEQEAARAVAEQTAASEAEAEAARADAGSDAGEQPAPDEAGDSPAEEPDGGEPAEEAAGEQELREAQPQESGRVALVPPVGAATPVVAARAAQPSDELPPTQEFRPVAAEPEDGEGPVPEQAEQIEADRAEAEQAEAEQAEEGAAASDGVAPEGERESEEAAGDVGDAAESAEAEAPGPVAGDAAEPVESVEREPESAEEPAPAASEPPDAQELSEAPTVAFTPVEGTGEALPIDTGEVPKGAVEANAAVASDAVDGADADVTSAFDHLNTEAEVLPSPEETEFFEADETAIDEAAKDEIREERKRRGVGLKAGIVLVVLCILVAGAGAVAYFLGYGYPSQETVASEFFTAATQGGDTARYWGANVEEATRTSELTVLKGVESFEVDAVERSSAQTSVYVKAQLVEGGTTWYKVAMARSGISWNVQYVELYFPSAH